MTGMDKIIETPLPLLFYVEKRTQWASEGRDTVNQFKLKLIWGFWTEGPKNRWDGVSVPHTHTHLCRWISSAQQRTTKTWFSMNRLTLVEMTRPHKCILKEGIQYTTRCHAVLCGLQPRSHFHLQGTFRNFMNTWNLWKPKVSAAAGLRMLSPHHSQRGRKLVCNMCVYKYIYIELQILY